MVIFGGRCHGPNCEREAVVEFWCGEQCQARWEKQFAAPRETVEPPVEVDPTSQAQPLPVAILGDTVERFSGPVGDLGAPSYREAIRNLGASMGAIGAAGMTVASLGIGREAAEAERRLDRPRAACPDAAEAAVAEARRRAYTGLGTFEQAVESVITDAALGKFPAPESATYPQVASENLQVAHSGWRRLFNRWRRA